MTNGNFPLSYLVFFEQSIIFQNVIFILYTVFRFIVGSIQSTTIYFFITLTYFIVHFRIINCLRAITFTLATEINRAKQFRLFCFSCFLKCLKVFCQHFKLCGEQQFFWQTDTHLSKCIRDNLNVLQHVSNNADTR